jgi:hypothetical protein
VKIQDAARKFPPFDVASGLAADMLTRGYVKVDEPAPKRNPPDLKWTVRQGPHEGDYQYAPMIYFSCSGCGTRGRQESSKGTAHLTINVRHCGLVEECPRHIANEYVKAFGAWKGRSLRKQVERVSKETPKSRLSFFGLKSKEELIAEAVAVVQKQKLQG